MDRKTKKKLEAVRSLLGPKGATLGLKELIAIMANLSEEVLRAKKFGKKRALDKLTPATQEPVLRPESPTPAPELPPKKRPTSFRKEEELKGKSNNPRYIPQKVSHFIWNRDQSQCTLCASKTNLNIDHILPVALGGTTEVSNLRLLCFHRNQREAIKYFGIVDWKVQKQKNFRGCCWRLAEAVRGSRSSK